MMFVLILRARMCTIAFMIPLRDAKRSKRIPFVNYSLITLCGAIFVYEMSLGDTLDSFIRVHGIIPVRVHEAFFERKPSLDVFLTLFTSIFLHGGWAHLIGNMLYLYIFGHNVEDRIGHKEYFLFFMLCGVGAGLTEVFFHHDAEIPLIGASGAIAGVLGGYFLLFPRSRILTMIPLVIFFPVIEVSAFFFLGFWFLLQFLQGTLSMGASEGIAWWAHAGGFVVGAVLIPIFLLLRKL